MTVIVLKDGRPINVRMPDRDAAFVFLLKWQGQSVSYALEHGGYEIVEVPDDRWSEVEARHLVRTAQRMLSEHDCGGSRTIDARVNCQACCLAGYQPSDRRLRDGDVRTDGPNVSNWQRDYIQAGRHIPSRWRHLIDSALDGTDGADNEPWRAALALDVATFGIR